MSGGEAVAWREVAKLSVLDATGLADVAVANAVILLIRDGDTVRAVQGLCPHQFARLADGTLSDGWLHCPQHMARFRVADGACGPGWTLPALRRYAVRIEEGAILLPDPLVPLDD